jgi:predicted transcriptional regulator of viral defense system
MATLSYMGSTALTDLPQVFTHAEALASGISDRNLYRMRDEGDVERLGRGIYARPGLGADPDLVEVAIRSSWATLCLTSALAHHDLSDDIPSQINVALPRTQRSPKTQAPIRWHRFDDNTFEIGRSSLALTDELAIGLYSPARSIIDAYRLRHLYGIEQAHEALKRWLRGKGTQPSQLLVMSKHFPTAEPTLRTALEILL